MDGPGLRLRHRHIAAAARGAMFFSVTATLVWSLASGATAGPLPATFTFMQRHEGDAGWYDARIEVDAIVGSRSHSNAPRFLFFEVLADQWAMDEAGTWRMAHGVHQDGGSFGITEGMLSDLYPAPAREHHVFLENAHLFDAERAFGQQVRWRTERVVPSDEGATRVMSWTNTTTFSPDPGRDRLNLYRPLLCGLSNPTFGTRSLDGALRLSTPCGAGNRLFSGDGFEARQGQSLEGAMCVRFAAQDLQLTFCENRSVPVEIRVQVARDLLVVYDLAAWVRGAAPPSGPPDAANTDDPYTPSMAPFVRYGPAEAGFAHAFPPSRAYEAVIEDQQAATWLAERPSAALVHLEGRGTAWRFTWSDGRSSLRAEVDPGNAKVESFDEARWTVPAPSPLPMAPTWVSAEAALLRFGFTADGWSAAGAECQSDRCEIPRVSAHNGTSWKRGDVVGQASRTIDLGADGRFVTYTESVRTASPADAAAVAGSEATQRGIAGVSVTTAGAAPRPPYMLSLAAGAAVGLGAALWPSLRWGVLLYSRIGPDRLLEHPARTRIVAAVEREAGIHFSALRREADLPTGTLDFHLRKLVAAGLVKQRIANGYACYFPQGQDRQTMVAAPFLRGGGARRVVEAVAAHPGIDTAEVAAVTGLDASTVRHHVRRLARAMLVAPVAEGKRRVLHPTSLALRMLP